MLLVGAFTVLAVGCATSDVKATTDSADVATVDTAPPAPVATSRRSAPRATLPQMSRTADSLLPYLVFVPVGQAWFTAAVRNKRMLVDIGRVDIDVRKDSARAAGYREAVEKRATVPLGTIFRLRGAWGAFDVKATEVDVWDGRIVLRVTGPPALDSIVRAISPVVATAFRTDSATSASADSCDRATPLGPALVARLAEVRDSLERELRTGPQPPYERLRRRMTVAASQVAGCFGTARAALVVTLKAANAEWVRERLVLVDTIGRVTPMRVSDYRFRGHELLQAFDADGDGIDDLATRASTERGGATTVLAIDIKARRATRLAVGFVREEQ
jgi:hypothetical protein